MQEESLNLARCLVIFMEIIKQRQYATLFQYMILQMVTTLCLVVARACLGGKSKDLSC